MRCQRSARTGVSMVYHCHGVVRSSGSEKEFSKMASYSSYGDVPSATTRCVSQSPLICGAQVSRLHAVRSASARAHLDCEVRPLVVIAAAASHRPAGG